MEMNNNIKYIGLSSSDDNFQDETLSNEDDPLFDVPAEAGSERRLRARRILMKLHEASSEEPIRRESSAKVKNGPAKEQKQRFKNEAERMERRRLMARQRSQRARDRKRAMSITFTNATNVNAMGWHSDAMIKEETPDLKGTAIKKEIMTTDDLIQMLDPLQCVNAAAIRAAAIKEEPCDLDPVTQQAAAVDPLNSAVITVDVNKIRNDTEDDSRCLRSVKMEQTKRIAGVLNNYNEKDDDEDYIKNVPRDQIERMRLYHARRKVKKTVSKHIPPQRKASERYHADGSRLRNIKSTKDEQALVEDCSTSLDELKRMLSGSGIGGNDDDYESSSCDSLEVKKLNSVRKRSAMRQRERRARETQAETEARLLRQRISQMKLRLYTQIMSTEEEIKADRERKCMEMRLKRQRRREAETPEQATARKKRESRIYAESRNRIKAIETPEETAARRAFSRERNRKRYEDIKARETMEQRAARKERERLYRENHKRRKLEKPQTEQSVNKPNTSCGSSNCNTTNITEAEYCK